MNRWIPILLLTLLSWQGTAQLSYWSRVYDYCPDTATHSSVNVAQCTEDSFFVAAGLHWRPGSNFWQTYVTTIDYKGNILHKRTLDFAGKYNRPNGFDFSATTNPLIRTHSENYLLTGYEFDLHSNSRIFVYQPWLYFFNADCDSVRFVKYKDTNVSRKPYALIEDKDYNIIVTGFISTNTVHLNAWDSSYYWDSGYVWLAKYDSTGDELWSRKYFANQNYGTGLTGLPTAVKVINGGDGNSYVIAASVADKAKGYFEVIVMKTDTAGNVLWHKSLPKPYLSWNDIDIVALKNGGYGFISTYNDTLPVGWGGTTPGGYPHIYYGKLDEQGDTVWTRKFRGKQSAHYGKQIMEADNGDLLLYGTFDYYKGHNIVLRTDSNGRIKWYREYAHIDTSSLVFQHYLTTLTMTPSKQLLLSGSFTCSIATPGVFDSTGQFSWFVLTDTFGCIEPGCQAADTMWEHYYDDVAVVRNNDMRVRIYPNPVKTSLYVQTPPGLPQGEVTVELIDVMGRKCLTGYLLHSSIDVSGLVPGVYIVRVNGVVAGRVVKE